MEKIIEILSETKKNLQNYINEGHFDYCPDTDTTMGLVDMNTDEFVAKVSKSDYTRQDNAIWFTTKIQVLTEVIAILEEK